MKSILIIAIILATVFAEQQNDLVTPQYVNHVQNGQQTMAPPAEQRFVQNQDNNNNQGQTQQFGVGPSGANYPHTVQMPGGTVYNSAWQPIGNSLQNPNNVPRMAECPCAGQGCPGGCSNGQNVLQCSCAPEAACPPCIIAKTMKQMHEMAASNAEADAATQVELFEQTELEAKLFEQAQKYAAEAAEEEKLAREAAMVLQEHASKAQIARNKMIRAENQAKQIAMKTLNTMTIHPPHTAVGVPGLSIKQVGITQQTVSQATPAYQIHVVPTDASGFHDMIGQEINEAVAMDEPKGDNIAEGKIEMGQEQQPADDQQQQQQQEVTMQMQSAGAPDSIQEAQLDNDVYSTAQDTEAGQRR